MKIKITLYFVPVKSLIVYYNKNEQMNIVYSVVIEPMKMMLFLAYFKSVNIAYL